MLILFLFYFIAFFIFIFFMFCCIFFFILFFLSFFILFWLVLVFRIDPTVIQIEVGFERHVLYDIPSNL